MKDKLDALNIISEEEKENLHQKLSEFEKDLNQRKKELTKIVREYPLTSVAIALGVGYLIGKMFSRNR